MAKRGKAVVVSVNNKAIVIVTKTLIKSFIVKFLSETTGVVVKKVGQYSKRHRVMQPDASLRSKKVCGESNSLASTFQASD